MSFLDGNERITQATNDEIRSCRGLDVYSFPELVEKVALISFHNPEHVLLFRGQKKEYRNMAGLTYIKPSIFRPVGNRNAPPRAPIVRLRYQRLRVAEMRIVNCFRREGFLGRERVARSRILQWAIIQHYGICATPLLDVTHSLRVAASFATMGEYSSEPIICVLAAPSLGGTISASSEQGIQSIRLSSICPPVARRPYFQEGYLLGEYPDLTTFSEKQRYAPHEIDFGLRLLAKFHIASKNFWNGHFSPIPEDALFPNARDPLYRISQRIKRHLPPI